MLSVEQRVRGALLPLCAVVEPLLYRGPAKTYIVFNYDSVPAVFADSTAAITRELVQVHFYLPHGTSPVKIKRQIARALAAAGATYPSITNASDDSGQHYVFECELLTDYGKLDN